jgi:hypothetical protein
MPAPPFKGWRLYQRPAKISSRIYLKQRFCRYFQQLLLSGVLDAMYTVVAMPVNQPEVTRAVIPSVAVQMMLFLRIVPVQNAPAPDTTVSLLGYEPSP